MWEWRPFEELINVDTIVAKISDHQSDLSDEESLIIASSVPARVREFTAGRSLARAVLEHRDIHLKSIPVGSAGQPVWPKEICGSISHTGSHVGVAIASQVSYRGIGFDIEKSGSANNLDDELILTRGEIDRAKSKPSKDYATRVFSCKEAVFKAVFPIVGEVFEFGDVEIKLAGDEFTASMTQNGDSSNVVAAGHGTLAFRDELLASIFCV